ncbi:MAG: hypothetical protein R2867_19825 [Caldilineaceae bacterium]
MGEYLSLAGADVVDCDWYGDPECWAGVTRAGVGVRSMDAAERLCH